MGVDRIRQLRGVVLLLRAYRSDFGKPWREALSAGIYQRGLNMKAHEPKGCRWCGIPGGLSKRQSWHPDCVRQYIACQGLQRRPGGMPLIPHAPCEMCDAEWTRHHQLDHHTALSVAFEQGPREFVRAFLLDNLRWLCRACHVKKTADDRRELADLKRKQVALF